MVWCMSTKPPCRIGSAARTPATIGLARRGCGNRPYRPMNPSATVAHKGAKSTSSARNVSPRPVSVMSRNKVIASRSSHRFGGNAQPARACPHRVLAHFHGLVKNAEQLFLVEHHFLTAQAGQVEQRGQ